jgi:ERCC4-type nuclease
MLDDREHGLRELLPSWPIAHLAVGDIWIGYSETQEILENGLIIERKSVADLEASILDNRYREQRSRIMAYATEKKAHAIYIIEGELDRLGHVRLTKQALLKYITRLSIRYHIPVFLTASLKETAELCKILHDQWTTDPKTFEQPATLTYIETRGKTRESNTDDPNVFLATLLQACRGISSTGALAIISVFPSLEALMKGTVEEFTAIQVGKQRLGVVKATRLHTLLHNH